MIREVLKNVKDLPLVKDCEGNLPIMTAIETNNVLLCQELLTTNLDEQVKSLKVFIYYLKSNFVTNITFHFGYCLFQKPLNDSLLHLATRKRNGDLIKAFIEAGCSIDRVNAEGQTCLHIAALNGDEMALRLVDCT